jgi:hypothetical protein
MNLPYDGRKPEPPYQTSNDVLREALKALIEKHRTAHTEQCRGNMNLRNCDCGVKEDIEEAEAALETT